MKNSYLLVTMILYLIAPFVPDMATGALLWLLGALVHYRILLLEHAARD